MSKKARPQTYRDILRKEFETRVRRSPSYSMRAFARDLLLFPSHLSQILNGKQGLSVEAGRKIAAKLHLSESERDYFCDSIASLHERSRLARETAKARLLRFEQEGGFKLITPDVFSVISDWYHLAILELLEVEGAQGNVNWISSALDLPARTVSEATDRLVRLGLLRATGSGFSPVADAKFLTTTTDVPSVAIRTFHEQILAMAIRSLNDQDVHSRDISSMIMAIPRARLPEAKEKIRQFRRTLNRDLGTGQAKDSVYCLAIQFFGLTP